MDKKIRKFEKHTAIILVIILVITGISLRSLAMPSNDEASKIVAFGALPESIAVQHLKVGDSLSSVIFPDTLQATIEKVNKTEIEITETNAFVSPNGAGEGGALAASLASSDDAVGESSGDGGIAASSEQSTGIENLDEATLYGSDTVNNEEPSDEASALSCIDENAASSFGSSEDAAATDGSLDAAIAASSGGSENASTSGSSG